MTPAFDELQRLIESGKETAAHWWEAFRRATELPNLPEAVVLSPGLISVIVIVLIGYLYFRTGGSR